MILFTFCCVFPQPPLFPLILPYLSLIILFLLSTILYLLYSTTRTLFLFYTSLCSRYMLFFVLYTWLALWQQRGLFMTHFNSIFNYLRTYKNLRVGTYSVVRTLYTFATEYTL